MPTMTHTQSIITLFSLLIQKQNLPGNNTGNTNQVRVFQAC